MTVFLPQGISAGVMSSLMGVFRGIFPQICEYMYFSSPWSKMFSHNNYSSVDYTYEHEQKRTYLPMLIQVGIYLPLLVGLFLLYPWLAGSKKIKYSQQTEDSEDQEKTKLITPGSHIDQ